MIDKNLVTGLLTGTRQLLEVSQQLAKEAENPVDESTKKLAGEVAQLLKESGWTSKSESEVKEMLTDHKIALDSLRRVVKSASLIPIGSPTKEASEDSLPESEQLWKNRWNF